MSTPSTSIIIKRVKKVSGGGHHGGAWKVAYADFVTAMMAFFLLMWLLNATTEDQRKGIAEYFDPTIPISPDSGGGKDALNGSTVTSQDTLAKNGTGQTGKKHEVGEKQVFTSQKKLETLQKDLQRAIDEGTGDLAEHIQTRVTAEGIVIELVDSDGSPLFASGSAEPSPVMLQLLDIVADVMSQVANKVAIVGHTDAAPFSRHDGYGNWELSTDRAGAARRRLVQSGLPDAQISEVAGKADTDPLLPDPNSPQNRRISITLVKG
ncbi:MAG: OmpA family protein [Parvularculaceae bacterium]|nr:OmpA family protein [Parvularculaceae bacterium]